jgi:hypothetical protein
MDLVSVRLVVGQEDVNYNGAEILRSKIKIRSRVTRDHRKGNEIPKKNDINDPKKKKKIID